MRGPWDRQNHHTAFAVDIERPDGAGFYPEDITEEAWKEYLDKHPDEKDNLESLVTMVLGKHVLVNGSMD